MNLAEEVRRFVEAANNAKTINALQRLMERTIRKLGIDYFALAHHVMIYNAPSNTVFVHNYPEPWAATIHVREYMRDDPVTEISSRQTAPYRWSDMPKLVQLSRRQREILRESKRAGLVDGFSVPVHMPDEPVGSCSFAATRPIPNEVLPVITAIGLVAFEAARRLVRLRPVAIAAARGRMSARERECVLLAARGATDAEISRMLGLAESTVTRHIEDARHRCGCGTRMELVARALYRQELKFEDLIEAENELAGRPLTRRATASDDEPAPMSRLGALFFGTNPSVN